MLRPAWLLFILLLLLPPILADPRTTKAGLPWASSRYVPMTGFTGDNTSITWYYTWSPATVEYTSYTWDGSKTTSPPFAFVPQIWGIDNDTTTAFLSALAQNFTSVKMLPNFPILTYNEPNQPGQAFCSPSAAAEHWKTYLEPLRQVNGGNWTLSSPVVTSAFEGKTWLNEFMGNCSGCGWDFGAVHWYDVDAEAFVEYVEDFHDTFGNKSLWVTEWACQNFNGGPQANLTGVHDFMNRTISYMDSVNWIDRYAWFAPAYDMQNVSNYNSLLRNTSNDFQSRSGVPSELGVKYGGVNGTMEAMTSRSGKERWMMSWRSLVGIVAVTMWLMAIG